MAVRRWACCLLVGACCCFGLGGGASVGFASDEPAPQPTATQTPETSTPKTEPAASQPKGSSGPATVLDEPPAPISEKSPRTEQQKNHLEALSLFSTGRIAEQHEQLAPALRLYQRALRLEPNATPIIRQIIPLAFSLDRPNEAVRYALKAAELEPGDPLLLRQLGLHLTETGKFDQALKLYEQARSRLEKQPRSAAYVLLTMELGRLCFVTDRQRQAAEAFAEVMKAFDKPEDFGLNESQRKALTGDEGRKNLDLFAEAFLTADRPDDALAAYEKMEKLRSDKALYAYHQARVSQHKKQFEQALEQLQAYFDQHATVGGAGPYELLSKVLTDLNKQGTIVERLEALSAQEPKNRALLRVLARAELTAGNLDKAEAAYKELLKDSASDEVYEGLTQVYRKQSKYPELLKTLGRAAADTTSLEIAESQIKELAKAPEAVEALAAAGRKLLADKPDSLGYGDRLALGLLGLQAKKFDMASEFFELALKSKRDEAASLYESWGIGLLMGEQYADAAKVFQRAIDEKVLPAGNTGFHLYLAGALEMADKTDEALAVARAALALPNPSPRMYSRLAWILYHAKRTDEAAKAYEDLIARYDSQYQSEDTRGLLRDARLALSNIRVMQKRTAESEELLEQVLDEYPENISALNDLGYLWAEHGKHLDRALTMIQQAVTDSPENAAYRDSLGWAYYMLGRYPEAIEQLQKAISKEESPDGVMLDHLGDAQQKAGQLEAARESWRRAVESFERDKEAEKAAAARRKLEERK
ncbi:MAG TPA: tetratricopeptide repeat protein [Pirellulales bacterium]